ncbi:hypothetical protein SISSUDRAFT_1045913 [Sistotremastrum suecicum HHB10207 ss-3]|uniref:Uncharacterized protein n=1 Tax=Sistotremastrum suecicum HHB10207 ss-3 TaxID=1314776 RepID=A0A166E2X7_9AGAM|nr:hypothetical protein SISSUDRAFT_1045913 [Sistotremastrum suecicum HHB10207 ss-3]
MKIADSSCGDGTACEPHSCINFYQGTASACIAQGSGGRRSASRISIRVILENQLENPVLRLSGTHLFNFVVQVRNSLFAFDDQQTR